MLIPTAITEGDSRPKCTVKKTYKLKKIHQILNYKDNFYTDFLSIVSFVQSDNQT